MIDNVPTFGAGGVIGEFKFWCQKVLPLVYDDSLSYYEVLCKVAKKLNEVIESANTSNENVEKLRTAYTELMQYVNEYFANVDVPQIVEDEINEMSEDGRLYEYLISRITLDDIGAAPAGYGLGTVDAPLATDCDTTVRNGWYIADGTTANKPFDYNGWFTVASRYGTGAVQDFYAYLTTPAHLRRFKINDVWSEWEWVNPTASIGAEYRTIERWNGKPVYSCLVNFGNLPNNTSKSVGVPGDKVATNIVRFNAIATNQGKFAYDATKLSGVSNIEIRYGSDSNVYVNITTNTDMSAYSVTYQVWYTKN